MLRALVEDLQRLAVVARAVAGVAGHVHVGQEVHLHLDHAVALAGLAAPAGDVEAEAPRPVAALARRRHLGEQLAHRREQPRVGGRVAARRAADRALVDVDHLVEGVQALDLVVRRRLGVAAIELARHRRVQRVVDQRALARAGHAGDAGEQPHRDLGADVLQVVAARIDDAQHARVGLPGQRGPRMRRFDAQHAAPGTGRSASRHLR